ncbi:MAG: hypothetical protein ACOYIA_04145 [Eubacteriales bacterium]|jgi:hypothetical protein
MLKFLKRIFVSASIYFTAITFLYAIVIALVYGNTEDGGLLSAWRTVMFFAFSLSLAAANGIFYKFGRRIWAVLSHALLTGAAFYLFMILPAEIGGSTAFAGMVLYYIIYAIAGAIILTLLSRSDRKKEQEKEYQPVYSRKKAE